MCGVLWCRVVWTIIISERVGKKTNLLNCLGCQNIITMNDNRVLSDFWRIVLVKPVIVFRKVTLLRDPELNRVVLHPEEQESKATKESEDKRNDDNWDRLLTGHNSKSDIENDKLVKQYNPHSSLYLLIKETFKSLY